LVSKKIEESVLDYIAKLRGLATVNGVVRYVEGNLSKPPTLKLIKNLESERKINIRRGRKGQSHYLSINDKNQFNQIKKQLLTLENFIKEINRYLQKRNEENDNDISLNLDENEEDVRAIKMDNRIGFVNDLYKNYYDTLKRILDDLFHVTTMSDLPKEDSENFLKKIIELKSQLKYLPWSKVNEKKLLAIHISNINKLIRKYERSGLEDYIEEKQIKNEFVKPLIQKINAFIVQFLD